MAQNMDQKQDLGTEKKILSVSVLAQTILDLNHKFLSHVIQGKMAIVIDICCSYLKGK
jgi:hypothetical protein